jgi:hypothetical protein
VSEQFCFRDQVNAAFSETALLDTPFHRTITRIADEADRRITALKSTIFLYENIATTVEELPMRVQRQRRKGWKAPPNSISVCRPGPFGNPWTVEWVRSTGMIREGYEASSCVANYRAWLEYPDEKRMHYHQCFGEHEERRKRLMELLPTLRGKNLMCFCRLCDEHKEGRPLGVGCDRCEPCHVDLLLEFANR